jgi:hypothetical protein
VSFPVNSTSVETAPIKRVIACLQRTKLAKKPRVISFAAVFVCKKIVGSNSWSQHSWGNAVDLFPTPNSQPVYVQKELREIANTVVYHTTHKTVANRGRKLDVAEVIDHDAQRIWTPSEGWHPYGGTPGPHIHVSGKPLKTGTPPCAG